MPSDEKDTFWVSLDKALSDWTKATDNYLAFCKQFQNLEVDRSTALQLKMIEKVLHGKREHEFSNILLLCSNFVKTPPYSYSMLEQEFRQRNLCLSIHARWFDPTSVEGKMEFRVVNTNRVTVPFQTHYVVSQDQSFLKQERDLTIRSWRESGALNDEQTKVCKTLENESDEEKKNKGMIALNLELLHNVGVLITDQKTVEQTPNITPLAQIEAAKVLHDKMFSS
jgi:hypothetical protein